MTSEVIDGMPSGPNDARAAQVVPSESKGSLMTDFTQLADGYLAMWNATDANERRALIGQLCAPEVRYTDPLADVAGYDAFDATIAAVQTQFAGLQFARLGAVDGHHTQARFSWELGPNGAPAPVAGFDVVTTDADGRITRVLGFLDRVPSA